MESNSEEPVATEAQTSEEPLTVTEKPKDEHQELPGAYEEPEVSSQKPAEAMDEIIEETFEETTSEGPESSQEPFGEAADPADSFDGDS